MVRHIALIAALTVGLIAPAVSAQTTAGPRSRPGLRQAQQGVRGRIQQGVRSGEITPAELARLRQQARAVRGLAQSMRQARQAGARPAPGDRRQLRQDLRKLNRAIFAARHNRMKRGKA